MGIAHGQRTHNFLAQLVSRGYATPIAPGCAVTQALSATIPERPSWRLKSVSRTVFSSRLKKYADCAPAKNCAAFSDDELRERRETIGWLKASATSFEFWNDDADVSYDEQ